MLSFVSEETEEIGLCVQRGLRSLTYIHGEKQEMNRVLGSLVDQVLSLLTYDR